MGDLASIDDERDIEFRRKFLLSTLAVGAGLALLFTLAPGIDLTVSHFLKSACAGDARYSGWCHERGVLMLPRGAAMAFSAICIGVSLYAAVRAIRGHGGIVGIQQARCIFLLATFIAGPGLIANLGFKDNWGRARPREVVEFGGDRQFTPPLVPARQCDDNCSFFSGEASSVYAPFFAAALIVPHGRLALVGAGIVAGTLTGLVRMSTGGHFLSDILFAGVFMALTASLLHMLLVGFWRLDRNRRAAPMEALHILWPIGPSPATASTEVVK